MKAANDNRPAEFDARVVAELRYLRRAVRRFPAHLGHEDLVQETLLEALRSHHTYRSSMKLRTWLHYLMRKIAYKIRVSAPPVAGPDALEFLPIAPAQEATVAANEILRLVAVGPHSDTVSLLAAGDTMQEAASQLGITKQAVSLRLASFRQAHKRAA